MYSVLNYLEISSKLEYFTYFAFGLQLVSMGVLTSIAYYNQADKKNFFLILTVASFIMSDLFFILNKKIEAMWLLNFINVTCQTASYYFYVKYFLERTK